MFADPRRLRSIGYHSCRHPRDPPSSLRTSAAFTGVQIGAATARCPRQAPSDGLPPGASLVFGRTPTYYLRPTILNDDDRPRSDTGLQPRTNQLMILMDHYPMRSSLTICFSESGARALL